MVAGGGPAGALWLAGPGQGPPGQQLWNCPHHLPMLPQLRHPPEAGSLALVVENGLEEKPENAK